MIPIWRCDLFRGLAGYIHGCPACWVSRFMFTLMVVLPISYGLAVLYR